MSASEPKWEHARGAVLIRDDYTCQICGKEDVNEVDHIWPRAAGGTHVLHNLQACCGRCNKRKGDRYSLRDANVEQIMWLISHTIGQVSRNLDLGNTARRRLVRCFPDVGDPFRSTLLMLTRERWSGHYGLIAVEQIEESATALRRAAEQDYAMRIAECDAADELVKAMRDAGYERLREFVIAEAGDDEP